MGSKPLLGIEEVMEKAVRSFLKFLKGRKEKNIYKIISEGIETFKCSKEFQNYEDYMKENATISQHLGKLVGISRDLTRTDVDIILKKFTLKMVYESGSFSFDKKIFDENLNSLKEFFKKDTIEIEEFVFLRGFESDKEEIKLSDNLKITKKGKVPSKFSHSVVNPPEYRISRVAKEKKEIKNSVKATNRIKKPQKIRDKNKEVFDGVINSLRAFKRGKVDYSLPIMINSEWFPTSTPYSEPELYYITGNYELKGKEVESFKEFYEVFQEKPDFLDTPSFHFSRSYNGKISERLIDLIITAESLFERGGKDSIAIRCALFKEGSFGDKEEAYKIVRTAFNKRNGILHNGKVWKKGEKLQCCGQQITFEDLVICFRQILREAMKEAIRFDDKKKFKKRIKNCFLK